MLHDSCRETTKSAGCGGGVAVIVVTVIFLFILRIHQSNSIEFNSESHTSYQ